MNIAENVRRKIESYPCDVDGFSFITVAELTILLKENGGIWEDCRCGSSYCEICNGSVDPSWDVEFPDGSKLHIGNPKQVVYPIFAISVSGGKNERK